MKNIRRFVAALLVLTMVLALTGTALAAPKFTKDDEGTTMVIFTGSAYGYDKHSASSKSNVIVRKNSLSTILKVYGKKWVLLDLGRGKSKWFGVDHLKKFKWEYEPFVNITFSSGGSNMSKVMIDAQKVDYYVKHNKPKTNGKVNLRKTPSLKGKSYGTVKKGKRVKLTGYVGIDDRYTPFFQIKQGKDKYYVSGVYLDLNLIPAYDALLSGDDDE